MTTNTKATCTSQTHFAELTCDQAGSALPDALFGGQEAREPSGEDPSMWSRYFPPDAPFMKLALLDQLLHRPYHAVVLEGPFDLHRLTQDHAKSLFRSETSLSRAGKPSIDRLFLALGGGIYGFFDGIALKIYAPTAQAAAASAQSFRRYVKRCREKKPHFFVVSVAGDGPVAEPVVVERTAPVTDDDLRLHYGDDFVSWSDRWLHTVRERPSGVTVFYGPPGTGKTSFVRALMSRLLREAVFYYVPVSESEMLSSPKFVSFWIGQTRQHKAKIKFAILEDAKQLLLPRDPGTSEKVSNLLNIADGLLGDHLKLHVLATTNVELHQLDPAIVRPGRLAGSREFHRLSRAEAELLATAKNLVLPEQSDFSLAEVYGGAGNLGSIDNKRLIGFGLVSSQ